MRFVGIGVIYLTLVDQENNQAIAQPCYPVQCYKHYELEELQQILSQLLEFKQCEQLADDDRNFSKIII